MKDFIIIGSRNGLFNKDVFSLVQQGKITLGYTHRHIERQSHFCFIEPNGNIKDINDSTCWITDIPIDFNYIHPLTERYTPDRYPKYDNYDAINVDCIREIPCDYYGVMGVPVGFLNKHNPEQFEIMGTLSPILNGKNLYRRILIKRK